MAAQELFYGVLKNNANLKAYYRFEGNFTDSSSSGYNLTLNGSASDVTGVFGQAKNFPAGANWASVTAANLNFSSAMSVSVWVKLDSLGAYSYVCSRRSTSGGDGGWWFGFDSNNKIVLYCVGLTTNTSVTHTTAVTSGVWYHVAGVYDGAALRVYLNGVVVSATATGSITSKTVDFYVAANSNNTAERFPGTIDDLALFSTALSADQVKELYEGRTVGELWATSRAARELNSSSMSGSANLKAYYRMETGALTTDTSVSGYTLTNVNTVAEIAGNFGIAADFGTANTNKRLFRGTDNMGITYGSAQSYSFWVKMRTEIPSGEQWFFSKTTSGAGVYGYFGCSYEYNGGTRRIRFSKGDANYYTITLGTSDWHHIVLTSNGSANLGYLDGVQVASWTNSSTGSTYGSEILGLNIGSYYVDTAQYFLSAAIDDFAVLNTALTSDQVKELYQYKDIVGLWHLNGGGTDSSDSGYHLTNNNTVTFPQGAYNGCA